MSSWAEIDKDNKVIRVLVGNNNDPAGDEGYQWLIDNLGGTWIRSNSADKGMSYDKELDLFIWPKCHDEAVLNVKTAKWECTNKDHDPLVI